MPLTPVEIRHVDMKRAWLRGYRRGPVDELLEEIADSFEQVWRERADLSDRLEELEGEAAKHRELEALLRSTLVSAERAAQDMKEQARRESDLIVQEAHAESRRVTRESAAEKRRLEEDIVKIRAQLRAAFESLGEWPGDKEAVEDAQTSVTRPTPVGEITDSGIRKVARTFLKAPASRSRSQCSVLRANPRSYPSAVTGGPDFARFRELLESERARLQHARDAVHHEGSLLEETGDLAIGSGDHIADSATETYMRELDEGLEENADHILGEIEAALGRIEDGTYGLCTKCGNPIAPARLEAVPYATLCIDDKRALESGA